MPNYVSNSVLISGDKETLNKLKEQLGKPVHTEYAQLSNPVFSFYNVVSPTNIEAYCGKDSLKSEAFGSDGTFNSSIFMAELNNSLNTDESWYWWNVRNWGSKWDIGIADDEKYPETILEEIEDGVIHYRFVTPWSPVYEIFDKLSAMYPTLQFNYEYEEEQGWGGEAIWQGGELTFKSEYDIPNSHEEFSERDREDSCLCAFEDDPENWYDDCPREEVQA